MGGQGALGSKGRTQRNPYVNNIWGYVTIFRARYPTYTVECIVRCPTYTVECTVVCELLIWKYWSPICEVLDRDKQVLWIERSMFELYIELTFNLKLHLQSLRVITTSVGKRMS